jgi:hypothetical protein
MQKENKSRLIRKLLMLAALIGCLGVLTTSRSAAANDAEGCWSEYTTCVAECPAQGPQPGDPTLPMENCPARGCLYQYQQCMAALN